MVELRRIRDHRSGIPEIKVQVFAVPQKADAVERSLGVGPVERRDHALRAENQFLAAAAKVPVRAAGLREELHIDKRIEQIAEVAVDEKGCEGAVIADVLGIDEFNVKA